jgi:TRAP transporter TAXI family solute receptor
MLPGGWCTAISVVAALIGAGCAKNPEAAAPASRHLVISIPFAGGAWESIGRRLASEYSQRVPGVVVEPVLARGLERQIDAVQAGKIDLALEDAETAYLAFTRGTAVGGAPHTRLRAMAVMFSIAVQVAARRDSGIGRIEDLRGRRVDIGTPGSPVDRAARVILDSYGIGVRGVRPEFGEGDAVDQFRQAVLDARFFYSAFTHPVIEAISHEVDVRVLSIDREHLGDIQERHHFLKSTIIPAGTYAHQQGDIQTVGMDVLLICREDLPDALVHDLTRSLFDAVPSLEEAHPSARAIDPDRGPTAPIPLHPGAARFYREREILQ